MAFGNIKKEELIKICSGVTEDIIIKACSYIEKNEIPGNRNSSTHFVLLEQTKFPLKYVFEIANNKILKNNIKIGPGTDYTPDSWTTSLTLETLIPAPQKFKIITPYNNEGHILVKSYRKNLLDFAIKNGLIINDTPKDYTAIKKEKNIAEVHYVQKNYAKFRVIINYDLLDIEHQKNCKRVPDEHGWTLNGECWIDSEESLADVCEKISYIISQGNSDRKNYKYEFMKYMEEIGLSQSPSYTSYVKNKLNDDFENKIFEFTNKKVFEINSFYSLDALIKDLSKNNNWKQYNIPNGNGIPNAILNTHYRNFIKTILGNYNNKTKQYWTYAAGKRSVKWDEFYNDGIIALGWDELGDLKQYKTQDELINQIKEYRNNDSYPSNDSKANWEFANEMNVSDIVYVKRGIEPILLGRGVVQSDYLYDSQREEYKSFRKIQWTHRGEFPVNFKELEITHWSKKTLTNISESKYGDFCLKIEDIFMNKAGNNSEFKFPLNQILYGPPGTGKTYSVRKYIDDLLGDNPGLNIEDEEQRINNVVKDLSWYTAIAISMYRNGKNNKYKVANLQHQKIIKAFALTRENKNLRAALWAQMQIHTSTNSKTVNYTNRQEPYLFEKTEDSEWYLTEDGIKFIEENLSEQLELLDAKHSVRKIDDFYKFLTFHQSYFYEEFVEGIKPSINDESETSTINYEYNKGIFKEICQQANSDPNNKYLLIIDEINRGNISKIFGELITLIEQDKRVIPNGERTFENTETKEEQLIVTLPYTKSKFGVPNNLYILGTMNTSDRSIASIDIALRRRFKFKEMMPNTDLVADFGCGFKNIFEELNKKIKVLLDRDHQIGHSYFINTKYSNANISDLKEIWFSEVIPLLNEYFYCDWEKLKLVIPGFIKEIVIPEYLKSECEDTAYEFKTTEDFITDSDFETALKQEKY